MRNNEDEFHEEPLEIEDFSCVGPFEELIAAIEVFLRRTVAVIDAAVPSKVHVVGQEFVAARGCLDAEDDFDDFDSTDGSGASSSLVVEVHRNDHTHALGRLFGLPLFVLAKPTRLGGATTRSACSALLSLVASAADAAGADVPCFSPIGDAHRPTFLGFYRRGAAITRFSVDAFPSCPPQCRFVSSLTELLQMNLGLRSRVRSDDGGVVITVSKRYTLPARREAEAARHRRPHEQRLQQPDAWEDALQVENELLFAACGPFTPPFGTTTDPISGAEFVVTWCALNESDVIDTSAMTTLDPFRTEQGATRAAAAAKLEVAGCVVRRSEYELSHVAASALSEAAFQIVAHLHLLAASHDDDHSADHSADRDAAQSAARDVRAATAHLRRASEAELNDLVEKRIVCGALETPAPDVVQRQIDGLAAGTAGTSTRDARRTYFPGSFLARFAHVSRALEHADDVYRLWQLAVDALERAVEFDQSDTATCTWLPLLGVAPRGALAAPDLDAPLLVQKLQLLQICGEEIERARQAASAAAGAADGGGWDIALDDADGEAERISDGDDAVDAEVDAAPASPVATETKRLITNGEPLVEPPPALPLLLTSDALELQQQLHEALGSGKAATETRTQLQSDALLTDMCLFLHANRAHEGRVVTFADFVQWHSPRDFVAPVGGTPAADVDACLSERMRTATWRALWARATPLTPHQARAVTFHPAEVARQVLRWLHDGVTQEELLVAALHANVALATHRALSHRLVVSAKEPALRARVARIASELDSGLREAEQRLLRGGASREEDVEALRHAYIRLIRLVADIETAVSGAIAVELLLLPHGGEEDTSSAAAACSSLWAAPRDELVPLPAELWTSAIAPAVQQASPHDRRETVVPVQWSCALECVAERPIDTEALPQLMRVEQDRSGAVIIALMLSGAIP